MISIPLRTRAGRTVRLLAAVTLAGVIPSACSSILDVPPPSGVQTADALKNQSGAEALYAGAKWDFIQNLTTPRRLFYLSGFLSDELTYGYAGAEINIDARRTASGGGYAEPGNTPLGELLSTRSTLLLAIQQLQQYEPANGRYRIGEAYALLGYTELLLAEYYCAGLTLDRVAPNAGVIYGMPLTTDSLFAIAESHLDSAVIHANDDATVLALANSGLARTRLNRANFTGAAAAANKVPTTFVYNLVTAVGTQNFYAAATGYSWSCGDFNVANQEGGNGLDFVSARDPRLVTDSTIGQTCDSRYGYPGGQALHYPVKFGNPSTAIPLATGIDARLAEAEAALRAGNASWLTILNALRTTCTEAGTCATPAPAGTGGVAGLPPLTDPGTATGRQNLLFRERAFWQFGTGKRLGDLRRLVRQYNRPANTVFPTGNFRVSPELPAQILTYGEDISLTLPTEASGVRSTNPNYKGCLAEGA